MDNLPSSRPDLTTETLTLLHQPPPKDIDEFLNQPYVIEQKKIDEYKQEGFVKLENIIGGRALEYYRELIGFAVGHVFKDDNRPLSDKPVYERSFLQAFNLWLAYPAVKNFVFSTRFAQLARDLMRVDGVRLWFDQALYKQPGGRITDYHQDAGLWPVYPPQKTTTLWLALVDVSQEKGCMSFAKGSHLLSQETEFIDIFNAQEELELGENMQKLDWEWAPLASGDCTFHSGLTYHRAAGNSTNMMREAMTIVYMAHDAIYDFPESNPKADRHAKATSGLKRGEVIDSPLTPRLL